MTNRRGAILRIVVSEHIATSLPVGSESVVKRYGLGVSSATVRNEMAMLEEYGYIMQPHISAGRVPTDQGYRYYAEGLVHDAELPLAEQRTIRHQFHQAVQEPDEWLRLATAITAHLVGSMALVATPRSDASRLRHIETVNVQEQVILLLVVLQQTRVQRQLLFFDAPLTDGELETLSSQLGATYSGLTAAEIEALPPAGSALADRVKAAVCQLMRLEDRQRYHDVYFEGLSELASQPEFAATAKMRLLLELLEDRPLLGTVLSRIAFVGDLAIVIGGEHEQEALRFYSVVLAPYPTFGGPNGVLGVLGPTRLRYGRAIGTVRYVSSVVGELISSVRQGHRPPASTA